mmetsp:Transcript_83314/g.166752  ORF Transcript_83314/g.166752 Transcript_83314/m.166752 type:complete len:215 (+) Transcript_83314:322-966(+)
MSVDLFVELSSTIIIIVIIIITATTVIIMLLLLFLSLLVVVHSKNIDSECVGFRAIAKEFGSKSISTHHTFVVGVQVREQQVLVVGVQAAQTPGLQPAHQPSVRGVATRVHSAGTQVVQTSDANHAAHLEPHALRFFAPPQAPHFLLRLAVLAPQLTPQQSVLQSHRAVAVVLQHSGPEVLTRGRVQRQERGAGFEHLACVLVSLLAAGRRCSS